MGTVRRPGLAKGTIWGHLHIVGMFDDRRPPITVDARWGSLSSRGSRSASFSAVLPTSDPLAIKSVRSEYRAERDRARSPHLHSARTDAPAYPTTAIGRANAWTQYQQ